MYALDAKAAIPKGVAALAGFGRHPDSGKRAFKEVRHAVKVRV
jgi:hypothetical protein